MQPTNYQKLTTGLTKNEEWVITTLLRHDNEMRFVDLLNEWHKIHGNFSSNVLLRILSFVEGTDNLVERFVIDEDVRYKLTEKGKFYHLDATGTLYLNYPIYLHTDRAYLHSDYHYDKNISIQISWLYDYYQRFHNKPFSEINIRELTAPLYPKYYHIDNVFQVTLDLYEKGKSEYTLTLPYRYLKNLEQLELKGEGKYVVKETKHTYQGICPESLQDHLERLGHYHKVRTRYTYIPPGLKLPRAYTLQEIIHHPQFDFTALNECEKNYLEKVSLEEKERDRLYESTKTDHIEHIDANFYIDLDYEKNQIEVIDETTLLERYPTLLDTESYKNDIYTTPHQALTYQVRSAARRYNLAAYSSKYPRHLIFPITNPTDEWTLITNNMHIKITPTDLSSRAKEITDKGYKINGIFPTHLDLLELSLYAEPKTMYMGSTTMEEFESSVHLVSGFSKHPRDADTTSPLSLDNYTDDLRIPPSLAVYYFVTTEGTVKVSGIESLYTRNALVKSTLTSQDMELVNIHCGIYDTNELSKYLLLVTKDGYIKAVPAFELKAKHRASKYVKSIRLDSDDVVIFSSLLNDVDTIDIEINGEIQQIKMLDIVSTKMNKGRYMGKPIESIRLLNPMQIGDIL